MAGMTDSRGHRGTKDPSGIKRGAREGFRILRQDTAFAEKALDSLLPDPDRLMVAGQELDSPWRSPATDKVFVEVAGSPCFLKRFNPVDFRYRLKNSFRVSRAKRSFLAGARFLKAGIPTPEPLVCLEERAWRLLGRSYLLFPLVGDGRDLLARWPGWSTEERAQALSDLAGLLGWMHSLGIRHGDLNWRNILVSGPGGSRTFLLADLDGCRFDGGPDPALAERDLGHFLRDLRRAGEGETTSGGFLQDWKSAAGFAGEGAG